MRRGDVYAHATLPRQFVIVSTDRLTEAGTAIVAEVHPHAPATTQGMLAVSLSPDDGIDGSVLAWRVNYMVTGRLGGHVGRLSDHTMDVVDMALRTAMDL